MKFFFLGKDAFPLLIAAFLLLLQPLTNTSFSPARPAATKPSHHLCGCAAAATGACGCTTRRCCACWSGPREKIASASGQASSTDSPTIYLRVLPCGGVENINLDALGIKFILTGFIVPAVVNFHRFPGSSHKKPENQSLQPSVPPPEITTPFPTVFI